eukprot:GFUD01007415.1.p1 GENE.GFUD01007415.1~~GFUD01007415.1.p1  ORF type:complete len:375 (+),score=73.71 GFUD01007415.1:155-1126(+)
MEMEERTLDLVKDDRIETKFKTLGIEPELQISILSGLVQASGSSCYLNEEKKSNSSASMSLVYKTKTVSEEVFPRQVRNKIDTDVFKPKNGIPLEATHVVVGIDWGMTQTITCEYQNSGSEDIGKAEGLIKEKLEILKEVFSGANSDGKFMETEEADFLFYTNGDIAANAKESVTFNHVFNIVKNLQSKTTNSGRGVPLSYKMMSLDSILKICKTPMEVVSFRDVDEKARETLIQYVQSLGETKRTLLGIHADLLKGRNCVAVSTIDEFTDFVTKFGSDEATSMEELVVVVTQQLEIYWVTLDLEIYWADFTTTSSIRQTVET